MAVAASTIVSRSVPRAFGPSVSWLMRMSSLTRIKCAREEECSGRRGVAPCRSVPPGCRRTRARESGQFAPMFDVLRPNHGILAASSDDAWLDRPRKTLNVCPVCGNAGRVATPCSLTHADARGALWTWRNHRSRHLRSCRPRRRTQRHACAACLHGCGSRHGLQCGIVCRIGNAHAGERQRGGLCASRVQA